MGYLHVFWIGRKARFSQHSFPWRTGLTRRSRRRIIAIPTWRPRRGIAVTRMRSPVPSDGLEPIEPDRVVGLVPLQDGPDLRLLVTRHDHFVDPLERTRIRSPSCSSARGIIVCSSLRMRPESEIFTGRVV